MCIRTFLCAAHIVFFLLLHRRRLAQSPRFRMNVRYNFLCAQQETIYERVEWACMCVSCAHVNIVFVFLVPIVYVRSSSLNVCLSLYCEFVFIRWRIRSFVYLLHHALRQCVRCTICVSTILLHFVVDVFRVKLISFNISRYMLRTASSMCAYSNAHEHVINVKQHYTRNWAYVMQLIHSTLCRPTCTLCIIFLCHFYL